MFVKQQVYNDIPKLLENQCSNLFREHLRLTTSSSNSFAIDISNVNSCKAFFAHKTEQYHASRLIKNSKFIAKNNVIQLWNEDFIAG